MFDETVIVQGLLAALFLFVAIYAMEIAMAFARENDRFFGAIFMSLSLMCAAVTGGFVQGAVYNYHEIPPTVEE